jgi:hexosaminidase
VAQAALADAARKGYDGILSNGYYIDLIQPASQHYVPDPLPADSTLTPDEARHILGGEATMWAEWVTPETIDSRIWPRTGSDR